MRPPLPPISELPEGYSLLPSDVADEDPLVDDLPVWHFIAVDFSAEGNHSLSVPCAPLPPIAGEWADRFEALAGACGLSDALAGFILWSFGPLVLPFARPPVNPLKALSIRDLLGALCWVGDWLGAEHLHPPRVGRPGGGGGAGEEPAWSFAPETSS